LLNILEDRARAATFDYSSTQLLAQWLQEIIRESPELEQAATSLAGLAQSVEISTGRGQSEIWSIFRRDSDGKTDVELRDAVSRVRDPSMFKACDICGADEVVLRHSVLQALVARQSSADFDVQELHDLLSGFPAHESSSKRQWLNWDVLAGVELHALSSVCTNVRDPQSTPVTCAYTQTSASESTRLLTNEPNTVLNDLVDLQSISTTGRKLFSLQNGDVLTWTVASPSVVFDALASWLHRTWSHPVEGTEVSLRTLPSHR